METIEIYIKNFDNRVNINIDLSNNKIYINQNIRDITNEQIEKLFRIIRTWDKNYYQDNIIDGEEFLIKIITKKEIDVITGKGGYPENYSDFKKWIGELND